MLLTAVAVVQLARCVASGDVVIHASTLTFASSEKGGTITCPVEESARDFTKFGSLQWTFRSTSTIKWNLGFRNAKGETTTFRVMPYEGVRATASLPIRYFTTDFLNNKAFLAHALSNWSNHIDVTSVQAVTIQMAPDREVQLDIGPITLSKEVLKDSAEIQKPVVDAYGQWIPDHPLTIDQIRAAWKREKFDSPAAVDRPKLKATGFFHTEEKDGKWWLVDPDGSAFFSLGMDCVRVGETTPTEGREQLFTEVVRNPYLSNTERRGSPWKKTTIDRLRSWGFNTVANWSDTQFYLQPEMPFVMNVSLTGVRKNWEGYPDVYSDEFRRGIEGNAARQVQTFKRERLLIGYFIGNEPHWQNRGLVDRILNDPEPSATQSSVKAQIAKGVSRDALLETLAREYFSREVAAIKKADPNHLVLGIRWAGTAPDPVMRANDAFDVFSINIYKFAPPADQIRKIYELCHRPIMIGEFHFGAVGRGMAPSLVMVRDQHERGVAYRYYVEQAAALAPIVGVHYFQFIDQPVTGRFDGENYNLGFVNVQDIPYDEMVSAAREAHNRVYRIHSGELAPTSEQAKVR